MSFKTHLRLVCLTSISGLLLLFSPFIRAEERVFHFRLGFEPATLDWTLGDVPILVTINTMRGLYRVNQKGVITPDLALSSHHDSHLKIWNFTLPRNLKWSDGVLLTPQHIVDGIQRLVDPKTASSYAYFLKELESIRETSPHQLEIKLKKPMAQLPAILSHWVTFPVRLDLIQKYKDYGVNPEHMAFLGDYRILSSKDSKLILNPNPFALSKPFLNRIEALIIPSDETAYNLYQSGRLDFMTDPGLAGASHPDLHSHTSPILYFIAVTPNHPLTKSLSAIHALSLALNRQEIPAALGVNHRGTSDFCPPEILATLKAKTSLEASPDNKTLKEAMFEDPKSIPPLTLMFFERPSIRDLAQWIAAQWKKNLKLDVRLDSTDVKSYWAKMGLEPSPVFINSKGAAYPDPDSFFQLFHSKNPQNLGRWNDSDYDRWIEEAAQTSAGPKRTELYRRASKRLLDEKPALIPLYFRSTQYLLKPSVHGLVINPLTGIDFRTVQIF